MPKTCLRRPKCSVVPTSTCITVLLGLMQIESKDNTATTQESRPSLLLLPSLRELTRLLHTTPTVANLPSFVQGVFMTRNGQPQPLLSPSSPPGVTLRAGIRSATKPAMRVHCVRAIRRMISADTDEPPVYEVIQVLLAVATIPAPGCG